jgi:hypothetical protein
MRLSSASTSFILMALAVVGPGRLGTVLEMKRTSRTFADGSFVSLIFVGLSHPLSAVERHLGSEYGASMALIPGVASGYDSDSPVLKTIHV